jgi:hypothetical protein
VETRRPAGGRACGGRSIQAASQTRARVIAALSAVAGAAAIAVALILQADDHFWPVVALVAAGVALLALALAFGSSTLIPWPLVALTAAYALHLGDGPVDAWSPLYAGAFLAVAETAYWSLELRGRAQDVDRLTERRAVRIVALALGGVAVGGLALAATAIDLGSGVWLDILGVVGAIAALTVLALVARPHAKER